MAEGPISIENIDEIFDASCIESLARFLPVNEVGLSTFGEMVRQDTSLFAKSLRRPNVNQLREQIFNLEEAGEAGDAHVVGVLIDDLYSENRAELTERWKRRHPEIAVPTSKDLVGSRATAICAEIASMCRDGGRWVEGHLRPSGRRSWELEKLLHAPSPDRNVDQVSAERELVINLSLTWLQSTGQSPPDVVNKDRPSPFAKFVKAVFNLVGSRASAIRRINEHGERRRLPLFVEAAIWKWTSASDQDWSSLPERFGDWRLIKNRFEKWPSKDSCERVFREMEIAKRSEVAMISTIYNLIQDERTEQKAKIKKCQREQRNSRKR